MLMLVGMLRLLLLFQFFIVSVNSAAAIKREQQPPLWIYIPRGDVDDFSVLDLDQHEIEMHLNRNTLGGLENAQGLYTLGAHSKSYASITLDTKINQYIPKGTIISGYNRLDQPIQGILVDDIQPNDDSIANNLKPTQQQRIKIFYNTNSNDKNHTDNCMVSVSRDPIFHGCFASVGNLTFDLVNPGIIRTYGYDPVEDNRNALSLQKLSIKAQDDMMSCPNCPYEDFTKYYKYYGKYTYANEIIEAAFNNRITSFNFTNNGNIDYSKYNQDGRIATIRKGIVILNTWMYIIHLMETAIDTCTGFCQCKDEDNEDAQPTTTTTNSTTNATTTMFTPTAKPFIPCTCNYESVVQIWDAAVALYTGSLVEGGFGGGGDNKKDGLFLFGNANKECQHFRTCGETGGQTQGIAKVNYDIFKLFVLGQANILSGYCAETRLVKEKIVAQMTIPIVQGVLRYSREVSVGDQRNKIHAIGSTYTAALLPLIHDCLPNGPTWAQAIQDTMKVGNDKPPNFALVKSILENVYDCFRIECQDVGGIIDLASANNGQYFNDAKPCDPFNIPIPILPKDTIDTTPTNTYTTTTTTVGSGGSSSNYNYPNEDEETQMKQRPGSSSSSYQNNNNNNNSVQKLNAGLFIGIAVGVLTVALILVLMCSTSWDSSKSRNIIIDDGVDVTVANGETQGVV